jgi:hypothetical protein
MAKAITEAIMVITAMVMDAEMPVVIITSTDGKSKSLQGHLISGGTIQVG